MSRRLGFSTLGEPGAGVEDIVRLVEHSSARAVELRFADDEVIRPGMSAAEAESVRDALGTAGADVLCLSAYVELCAPDVGALGAALDLATSAGAGGVRVFMKDPQEAGSDLSPGERQAIETLRAAAGRPGTVFVETHDSHSTAERMARFFTALDDAVPGHNARVLWDTAHTWAGGESLADSLALLEPWLAHLQVKDVADRETPVPVPLGSGTFPVGDLARALADRPVDVVLEWERRWHPELPPLAEALAVAEDWAGQLLRG